MIFIREAGAEDLGSETVAGREAGRREEAAAIKP
jgi:hypothetical protein